MLVESAGRGAGKEALVKARWVILAAAGAMLAGAGGAAAAGDAAAGHALARQWCATCHVVDDKSQGPDTAPSFAAVARRHGGDRSWVRAWLAAPHPPMSGIALTRQQIDDVVAFLDSLAPR
jgi:mono/diheme cytochrome c family protein